MVGPLPVDREISSSLPFTKSSIGVSVYVYKLAAEGPPQEYFGDSPRDNTQGDMVPTIYHATVETRDMMTTPGLGVYCAAVDF